VAGMKRPLVVNKRKHVPTPDDVYIGRPSKWGNCFSHMRGTLACFKASSREEAIAKYREWITQQPDLMAALPNLAGKTLVCWCKPASCHGDVLADLVEAL
jgi:hypothetical protein